MIRSSTDFNLGLDKSRMKDPRDAHRQRATVDAILARMFHPEPNKRRELQLLADEVGMGKTFVALATAYSIIQHLRQTHYEDDLRGCYRKILVVTPKNSTLFKKWNREVDEFVRRCVLPKCRDEAGRWFRSQPVERMDELVNALIRGDRSRPRVVVAQVSALAGGKLRHRDLKLRVLLGSLFLYWGNRFRVDDRRRLLKGAPEHWPNNPYDLLLIDDHEWKRLFFYEGELADAIARLDRESNESGESRVERVLSLCRELARPYQRNRDQLFDKLETKLTSLYRKVVYNLLNRSLPLVIVDEAHHWKGGRNNFEQFCQYIAPSTRRLLLLTATPFQLHPHEMLKVLEVSDHLQICPGAANGDERRELLKKHREEIVRPVLDRAAGASRRFAKSWVQLPRYTKTQLLKDLWCSDELEELRAELHRIAYLQGVVDSTEMKHLIENAIADVDPAVRDFLREALYLYTLNSDLSQELGEVVIRHRRATDHRLFRVGNEFTCTASQIAIRRDSHMIHASPGLDVKGEGELPHYLLMRCVSEMKAGKGRSSLGSALTGCYSTLQHSSEGKKVKTGLKDNPLGSVYLSLLSSLVGEEQDASHPKVSTVVDAVMRAWQSGEKSLIFCFRTNTAQQLRRIIDGRIRVELESRRAGSESLKTLRSRLTGRDRDLIVLGLDRVLWSWIWANAPGESSTEQTSLLPDELRLTDDDLKEIAHTSLQFDVSLTDRLPDRVFLHRATEHALARRIKRKPRKNPSLRVLLDEMAEPSWIERPYGTNPLSETDEGGEDQPDFDERGVHTRYQKANSEPSSEQINLLVEALVTRRERARRQGQTSIFDVYAEGPSLWLGSSPFDSFAGANVTRLGRTLHAIHCDLAELARDTDKGFDWIDRLRVMQALRRALLRESVLLRLLTAQSTLNEDEIAGGELLVRAFFKPMPNQRESMAERISVFLEDLRSSSGSLSDAGSQRNAFYDATRLRDQQFVALVQGDTKNDVRDRIFTGFNTPLLPEVLVCTSVGQEGIDLHRHCRNVIHYDLAWNPAVLEQRTGRADRIGSKTFRERELKKGEHSPYLEIGVPFLAGTYDDRMYEELRLRAQIFEVLTGGDLAADQAEGQDDRSDAESEERDLRFVPLPDEMAEDLRVMFGLRG